MENEILEVLGKIFADINIGSHVDNTEGWDSLNHLRSLLALEERFQIAFTPEEMGEIKSVRGMVAVISQKIASSR
jgi:acyl carrier protein